jgi:hypothetical protein
VFSNRREVITQPHGAPSQKIAFRNTETGLQVLKSFNIVSVLVGKVANLSLAKPCLFVAVFFLACATRGKKYSCLACQQVGYTYYV